VGGGDPAVGSAGNGRVGSVYGGGITGLPNSRIPLHPGKERLRFFWSDPPHRGPPMAENQSLQPFVNGLEARSLLSFSFKTYYNSSEGFGRFQDHLEAGRRRADAGAAGAVFQSCGQAAG